VAGPNGAGKTTLSREEFILDEAIVNADEIARALPSRSVVEAGRVAVRERRRLLSSSASFAFETTLAGRREFALLREARTREYRIVLHYVGVESPELCRARIDERVLSGGHDVPQIDLVRRFTRSLAHLPVAVGLADESVVYDNSSLSGITPMARFAAGTLVDVAPRIPRWMERALGPLRKR